MHHHAATLIRTALDELKPSYPRIFSSFGKDSLAVIHLAAQFDIRDVLYIPDLDEVYDQDFILSVVAKYQLRVTRCALGRAMYLPFKDQPLFMALPFIDETHVTGVPTSMTPWNGSGPFICLDEELRTTRGVITAEKTDLLLTGFKYADVQKATCPIPQDLMPQAMRLARTRAIYDTGPRFDLAPGLPACAPLFYWDDVDVWKFLRESGITVSPRVYDGEQRRDTTQRWCTRCHDPALPSIVDCPKIRAPILNTAALANPLAERVRQLGVMGVLTHEEAEVLSHG